MKGMVGECVEHRSVRVKDCVEVDPGTLCLCDCRPGQPHSGAVSVSAC